jgi:hypothetical protein
MPSDHDITHSTYLGINYMPLTIHVDHKAHFPLEIDHCIFQTRQATMYKKLKRKQQCICGHILHLTH